MVRIRAFTAEGPGSIPGWGTKIPQAKQRGQQQQQKKDRRGQNCKQLFDMKQNTNINIIAHITETS